MEFLVTGPDAARTTIALAHGAGAAMDTPFLNAVAEGLAGPTRKVVRFEFPYMAKRRVDGKRRGPDRLPILRDTWHEVIETIGTKRLIIGGKSMGGRIASMVADESGVLGVVCLGYPFHPPGQPKKLRVAHLEKLKTPTLILQGTRDTLGNYQEVSAYSLSSRIQVRWIDDGDHSFKPRVKSGRTLERNLDEAIEALVGFVDAL